MDSKNDAYYFNSEILSSELDLPKPSKDFNICLKKITNCTKNYSCSFNHGSSISIKKGLNVEDDLTLFLKSEQAERIRENLMKIFEIQHQRELDEIKMKRKKIFRFSPTFSMTQQKLSNTVEEINSNLCTSTSGPSSSLPLLLTFKENVVSLFRHNGDGRIKSSNVSLNRGSDS